MNYKTISWRTFHTSLLSLAKNIQNQQKKLDIIVAISRGGLTSAHILSDLLKLPVATITITSYTGIAQKKTPRMSFDVGGILKNKNILLVDDVSDTGDTFLHAIAYLKKRNAGHILTASVHVKPHARYVPDFFVHKTNAWIIYPYEMRESIEELTHHFIKKGYAPGIIKRQLTNYRIPKQFIELYSS